MADEFRVDVVVDERHQRLVVHGEVDLATAPAVEAAFEQRIAAGPRTTHEADLAVVADLTRCDFIDSTGVRTLVQIGRRVAAEGRRFSIVCPPGSGSRFTLDLLGVDASFPVHDSVEGPVVSDDPAASA